MRLADEGFEAAYAELIGDRVRTAEGAPRAGRRGFHRKAPGTGAAFSSAAELMSKELPPVRWVVPGILPEGVALLAGKPKLGKSWLALGLCVAVAAGGSALGNAPVDRGAALYMALEDNERRLQSRLRKLLHDAQPPASLDCATLCPRLDEGGLEAIAGWLAEHADARLVVLDTLAKVRPRASGKNVYQEDYEALEKLLPLAAQHNVAIVVVHHLRKQGASDPLDEVNSSIGLTGGVDGALILKRDRTRADASLFVTGRDVEEEKDLALRWSSEMGAWTLVGDAEEYRASQERQEILDYVREAGAPVGIKEVATGLEKNYKTVAALMQKMREAGALTSPAYGKYEAANLQVGGRGSYDSYGSHGTFEGSGSPPESPIGSVGTVRTSRKTLHSGVGKSVGTGKESANGTDDRRLTEEEVQRVKRLVREGMSPEIARREVVKMERPKMRLAADLADEGTLNAKERIKLALQDGPKFPADLAPATGLALKTVKNRLGELRRAGLVEPTGRVENQAEEVSLVSPPLLRDGDRDTPSEEAEGQGDQGDHDLQSEALDEEAPWYKHPLACGCQDCEKYG